MPKRFLLPDIVSIQIMIRRGILIRTVSLWKEVGAIILTSTKDQISPPPPKVMTHVAEIHYKSWFLILIKDLYGSFFKLTTPLSHNLTLTSYLKMLQDLRNRWSLSHEK